MSGAAALGRLRDAVRRHGLLGAAGALVRGGPSRALASLRTGEPLTVAAPSARRVRRWPPVLDAARTLSASDWERWLQRGPAANAPSPLAAPGDLTVVIGGGASASADFDATAAALRASVPSAEIVTAPPEAPVPDRLYLFLRAGDLPRPDLGPRLLSAAADHAEVVTFDLWRVTQERVQPMFLPGANLPLLQCEDYLHGRAALMGRALGEPHAGARAQILAWAQGRSAADLRARWRHLFLPLLCARIADQDLPPAPQRLGRRPSAPWTGPGASAVLCTRDKGHLTRQLVRSLLSLPPEELAEVVIVSNGTANPYALQTLADFEGEARVTVIRRDEPFNFSRLSNAGAQVASGGGPLLFINDDITPVSDGWLSALLSRLAEPGVGAVGPLLLYPREQVQHAGMVLRRLGGAAHILRGAVLPDDDYLGLAAAAREVSCLTGAVLLTDRTAFEAAGGFDEALAIGLQDVDYGLKLHRAGLRNLFEPRAILLHMESTSVNGLVQRPEVNRRRYDEWRLFMDRWGDMVDADPFRLAGFDLDDESLHRLVDR